MEDDKATTQLLVFIDGEHYSIKSFAIVTATSYQLIVRKSNTDKMDTKLTTHKNI